MKYKLSKDFGKSLSRLNGKDLKLVMEAIDEVEKASTLSEISNCKKLKSYDCVYRIRIGTRRAFFTFHIEIVDDILIFHYLVSRGQAYDKNMEDKLRKLDS